ncbi:unnamed protein product, partial [Chrysoparadoxa australica]
MRGLVQLALLLCVSCTSAFVPSTPLPTLGARTCIQAKQSGVFVPARRTTVWRMQVDEPEATESRETNYLRLQVAELASKLRGTNLYFIGMMGSGKSTVANEMAKLMRLYSYIDTDLVIEQLVGMSMHELFEAEGEEAMRDVEMQVLDQVHSYVKMVVATGGGIVLKKTNWGKLQTGLVIWLDMPVADIAERLSKNQEELDKRPLLRGDAAANLQKIFDERKELYGAADVRVPVSPGDSVEEVVLAVVAGLEDFIASNPPKWQQWKEQ